MKEVELLKDHRHLGFNYKKGVVIAVSQANFIWLVRRGIAKEFIKQTNKKEVNHE